MNQWNKIMEAKKLFAIAFSLLLLLGIGNSIQIRDYNVYLSAEKGVIGYTYTSSGENIMFGKMLPPGMHNQKQAYRVDMQNEKKSQSEVTAVFYYKGEAQLLDETGKKISDNIAFKDGKIYVYYLFPKDENYKFYIVGDGELSSASIIYGKSLPVVDSKSTESYSKDETKQETKSNEVQKPKTDSSYSKESSDNEKNNLINEDNILIFILPILLFIIIAVVAIKLSKPKEDEEAKHKIFKPGSKIQVEE